MLYSKVPCPPAGAETVIVPSVKPKQVTSVFEPVAASMGGSVIARAGLRVTEHTVWLASRILTSCVETGRLVKLPDACHVAPPSIEYPYVPYPPDGDDITIDPLFAPKHVIS